MNSGIRPMRKLWSDDSWTEYLAWQAEGPKALERVNAVIRDCERDPFHGIGKPEPLRGNLSGWWSRRITSEHRLVYKISGTGTAQTIEIAQCRSHNSGR